jgi:hypothetical protein
MPNAYRIWDFKDKDEGSSGYSRRTRAPGAPGPNAAPPSDGPPGPRSQPAHAAGTEGGVESGRYGQGRTLAGPALASTPAFHDNMNDQRVRRQGGPPHPAGRDETAQSEPTNPNFASQGLTVGAIQAQPWSFPSAPQEQDLPSPKPWGFSPE